MGRMTLDSSAEREGFASGIRGISIEFQNKTGSEWPLLVCRRHSMDHEELERLLSRCALKDQKALERLYRMTAAPLNTVAYRLLGSSDTSNDVLQEAFVQIWDKAGSYRPDQANPFTWMSSIVRYRAIDRLRQERRHQNRPPPEEEEAILSTLPAGESQDDMQHRFRLNLQLKACLEAMNDKIRQSIEMAYVYGYSREELADTLNANVNTIKSWLHRGGARLKDCLEERVGGTVND